MSRLSAPPAARLSARSATASLWQKSKGIIEPLEQRIVLATFTWALPGSGAWESAANWQLTGGVDADGLPDADDDVTINAANAAVVTITSARAANSLLVVGDDQIRLTSGSLTLSAASNVASLSMAAGTLTSNGLLTLTGASSLSGNAQLDGTVRNEGTLTLAGDPNLGAVLDNAGTVSSIARLDFIGGGRLNNLAQGVFEISGSANGNYAGNFGGDGFFNAGIFRHSGTANADLSTVPFHNAASGKIEVTGGGTLQINSAGTWEGAAFLVNSNSTLSIAGGAKTWTGAYTGSGAGVVRLSAGIITIGQAGASLAMPDGLLQLAGNAELIGSPITNTGFIDVSGDPNLGAILNNSGTIRSTARLDFVGGGQLNNLPGGVFEITGASNGNYAGNFGGAGFFNSGIFRHSGTANADLSTVPFHNSASGKIEVTGGGTLQINSNGIWEGADLLVNEGATLRLGGGAKTWTGTYTGAGDGSVLFNAGTITVGPAGATVNMPLGLLTFGGNAEINGAAWANVDGLMFTGDVNLGSSLNNSGKILSNGQIDFIGNGQLNNLPTGIFEITGTSNGSYAGNFGGNGFFNEGIFRHSGVANANLSTVRFNNAPDGRIELTGGGTLQISSDGVWEGAEILTGPGTTLIFAGGTKLWTGDFSGSGEGQIHFTAGAITVGDTGATLNFPEGLLEVGANAELNGSAFRNAGFIRLSGDPNLGATLVNEGTIRSTARLDFVGNGRLDNLVSGVFEITGISNGNYAGNFGGSGIFNSGIFRHAGTASADLSTVPFHNSITGRVEVTGMGTLQMNSNGTWESAEFLVGSGSTVILGGGTKTWTGGYTGSGEGRIRATAGTITAGAAGATLNFPTGMFEISGTELSGAPILNSGSLLLAGDPNLGATLNNSGVISSTARLDFVGNGRLNNLAGGLFEIVGTSNGNYFGNFGGPGIFNAGLLRHSGGSAASMSTVPFHNQAGGQIEVTSGTLDIGSSGTWQGAEIQVAAGATLRLDGGTKTWTGTFSGTGAGTVLLNAGTMTAGAEGATLQFPEGLFTISGNPTLNGGLLTNLGWLQFAGDPNLSTTLANSGVITSTARLDFTANGRLHNLESGLFEITGSSDGSYFGNFGGPGLLNEGILRYSGGGNANTGGVPLSNAGTVEVSSGSLNITGAFSQLAAGVLTGGTWRVLDGGTLSFPRAMTTNAATIVLDGPGAVLTQLAGMTTNTGSLGLQGGRDLTLNGGLVNSGTLVVGPGSLLTVNGAFSQPGGRLEMQIAEDAGLNPFGQMAVTGAAALGGTLAIKSVDGYSPDAGDGFSLITYGSRTGDFEAFEGIDQSYNPVFEVVAGEDEVRINSLVGAADLAVTDVAAPLSGFIGNEITVSYTVTNLQNRPTPTNEWTDVIYLSRDGVLDASDYLFARVPHTGGLGALASYTEAITARLPGAIEGEYQVLVVTDNRRVAPDLDRANNQLIAEERMSVDFAELALGTPSTGTIAQGQDVFFRIDLESGRDVFLTGDFEMPASAEFLVRYRAVPDRVTYDFSASSIVDLEQQIRLLNPRGGAYYVMLHGREGAGEGADFSILADGAPFAIDAIGQSFGANVGVVTVPLTGAGFTSSLEAELRLEGGGTTLVASSISVVNSSQAFATFDLSGVSPGIFDVVGIQGAGERFINDAFEVIAGEAGRLEAKLVVPENVRMTRPYTITVEFENSGGTDIPVPLLIMKGSEGNFLWAEGQTQTQQTGTLQFLGVGTDAFSGGVLRPGEKHVVTLNAVTNGTEANFKLSSTAGGSTELVDYAALRSSMGIAGEALRYGQAFDRVVSQLGLTYGEMIQDLAKATDEARSYREEVATLSDVFDYLIDREILELPNANVRGTLFIEDTAHRAEWPSVALRDTVTDALFYAETFLNGGFSFFDVPDGTYTLEADGFLSVSTGVISVAAGTPVFGLDVIADAGETLEGRVVGPTGRAVGSALVQITDAFGREFLTTTGINGRYLFEGLASGAATIDIDLANFVPIDDATLTLGDSAANTRDFTLSSGGTISGRVLSPTGTPVPGAELIAHLIGGDIHQSITAGFDGRFRLGGLPTGAYQLVATGAGFGAGAIADVQVTSGSTTPIDTVALTVGGSISGTVTDASTGLPIIGAQLSRTGLGQTTSIFSGTDGTFNAPSITPGAFSALVSAPGYIGRVVEIDLDSAENFVFDAALRPLGKIDGTVGMGGVGAPGLELTLLPLGDAPPVESYTVISGSNGSFSFSGLPDGEYALSLAAAGATVSRQIFTLDAADNTHTATLNLGAAELTGTVRGTDGTSLSSQVVTLFSEGKVIDAAFTDEQGRYRFLVFQPGPVDLIASGESVGVAGVFSVTVALGQTVSVPEITAGSASLTLTIDAAADGADLADARILVRSTTDALNEVSFGGFTDDTGQLVLPAVAPGEYEVFVVKDGFAAEVQRFTVTPGGSTLNFLLDPGHVILGTVRNDAGLPVKGAEVTIIDRATGYSFQSITDAAGNYQRNALPAGSFDVLISSGTLQAQVISDLTLDSAPVRADATLTSSAISLKGTVVDTSGDPIAGAIVQVFGLQGGRLSSTVTDAAGAYELGNLPVGEVRVAVGPAGFATVVNSVILPTSGETIRDFALGEAVAVGVSSTATTSTGFALPTALSFVEPAPSARVSRFDGLANNIVDSVPPPSPLGMDGVDYRFVFPKFDVDCPQQMAAYNRAVESGRQLNLAYQGLEIEYENLNAGNLAEMATLVEDAEKLGRNMVNLADGLIGIKGAIDTYKEKGLSLAGQFQRNLETGDLAFADALVSAKKLFKGGFSKEGIATLYNDINDATDALKGALGAFVDVDFNDPLTESKFGGDAKKIGLGGLPFIGDIKKVLDDIVALEAAASKFATSSQENRGLDYLDQQNYYTDKLQEHQQNRKALEQAIADDCSSPGPDPEDPEDQNPEDEENVRSVGSRDPNDIIGPVGFGPQNFVAGDQPLNYTIRFENVATATAAAQLVTITHQLDADVDASAFQLGDFGFGEFVVDVPAGRDFFEARIDARDIFGVFVDVEAKIDFFTGLATWNFSAIDPDTLDFTADPLAGFLPPNLIGGEGEGFVSYSIQASEGSASGTVIDAQATIVFDQNEAIDTPAIFHTLDAGTPSSSISALPAVQTSPNIVLNFASGDEANGSGLHSFDVYVSTNGGAYELFLNDYSDSSAVFRGENGQAYSFATVAKDNVGNTEELPLVPDATTTTEFQVIAFDAKNKLASFLDANGDRVTIKLKGPGTGGLILDDPDGDGQGDIDTLLLDGTTSATKLSVTVKKSGGGDGLSPIARVHVDGALGSFTARNSDLVIEGFSAAGAVKSIAVRDVTASTQFSVPTIEVGGSETDSLKIAAGKLGDGFSIATAGRLSSLKASEIGEGSITTESLGKLAVKSGAMNADLAITGAAGSVSINGGVDAGSWSAGSFDAITIKGGEFEADLTTAGALGKLSVTGGGITGDLEAGRFGAVSIKSGDLTGSFVSTDSVETLGRAKALQSLKIAGGDLAGDIHLLGDAGAISVKGTKGGDGGSVMDATILASRIASLIVGNHLSDSMIVAGAHLGVDRALGGTGNAEDHFGSGAIGKVQIKGDMTGAILAAGLSSTDVVLGNDDDTIIDSVSSRIASIIVQGSVSADSYFAAGAIAKQPRFNGVRIDPATDSRFLVG